MMDFWGLYKEEENYLSTKKNIEEKEIEKIFVIRKISTSNCWRSYFMCLWFLNRHTKSRFLILWFVPDNTSIKRKNLMSAVLHGRTCVGYWNRRDSRGSARQKVLYLTFFLFKVSKNYLKKRRKHQDTLVVFQFLSE